MTVKVGPLLAVCCFVALAVVLAPRWGGSGQLSAQQYFTGAGQTASGSLTAADATAGDSGCSTTKCVELPVGSTNGNVGTVAWSVAGTFSGTVVVEGTVDGTNWQILPMTPATTIALTSVLSATAPGIWFTNAAGFSQVHLRCSLYTSGTIVAFGRSSAAATAFN